VAEDEVARHRMSTTLREWRSAGRARSWPAARPWTHCCGP
jgi:hypothetical protein